MNNNKKWDREECRSHYVQSPENVSFTQLSEISGVNRSVIGNWSRKDPNGSWKNQRDQYWQKIVPSINDEAVREYLAENNFQSQLQEELNAYLKGSAIFRDVAIEFANAIATEISLAKQKAVNKAEETELIFNIAKKWGSKNINWYSTVLHRSLEGTFRCTGADMFINVAAATAFLESQQYYVLDPTDETSIRYLLPVLAEKYPGLHVNPQTKTIKNEEGGKDSEGTSRAVENRGEAWMSIEPPDYGEGDGGGKELC